MTDADNERSARLLREIFVAGFMSGLPASNVAWASARLASAMTEVRVPTGTVLYEKGQEVDSQYFIVEGEVKLESDNEAPYVFGDYSLIGVFDLFIGRARSRRAVATKASRLLRIASADWLDMMEDNFELTRSALEGLATDVGELLAMLSPLPGLVVPAPPFVPVGPLGLVDRIFALESVALFASAEAQALTSLALVAEEVGFEPGEAIFARGVPDECLVAVLDGKVEATRRAGGLVESYRPGELVFGSSAIAPDTAPREARAVARTRTLRIVRDDYLDVVEEHFQLARSSLRAIMTERELALNEKGRREPEARGVSGSLRTSRPP